ncbi:MAG: hypothetical protein OXR73_21035 [Myxococcales bacterium]|nr:hypothetical protein [Myxococcales bacterium]
MSNLPSHRSYGSGRWARLHPWLILVVALGGLPVPSAQACSFPAMPLQGEGVPGQPLFDTEGEARDLAVPHNPAFFSRAARPLRVTVDGAPVELTPLGPEPAPGDLGMVTVTRSLPSGAVVRVDDREFIVGGGVDMQAPEPPSVTTAVLSVHEGEGTCSGDSCGNYARLSLELSAPTDDLTSADSLAYAVYLGRSPGAARKVHRAAAFVLLEGGATSAFVDFRWGEADVYGAITAIDRAGNESERTDLGIVYRAPSGCAIGAGSRPLSNLAYVVAALWAVARAGRSRRRPSELRTRW